MQRFCNRIGLVITKGFGLDYTADYAAPSVPAEIQDHGRVALEFDLPEYRKLVCGGDGGAVTERDGHIEVLQHDGVDPDGMGFRLLHRQ